MKQHEFASVVYNSNRWKKARAQALMKAGGLCVRCLDEGIYTPATNVHHRIGLTPENINDPEIVYGLNNLEPLCERCHMQLHGKLQRRYSLDPVTGKVIF